MHSIDQATRKLLADAYAAFNARDIDSALAMMQPDVSWPNGMEGGYVHGHGAVRAYWTRQWQTIDPEVTPLNLACYPSGRVVVYVRLVVRDLTGRVRIDEVVQHAYTIEDGRIRTMEIRKAERGNYQPEAGRVDL